MSTNDLENKGWEQMRQLLDQNMPQAQAKKRPIFGWWGIGIGIVGAALVGYCTLNVNTNQPTFYASQNRTLEENSLGKNHTTIEEVITKSLNINEQIAESDTPEIKAKTTASSKLYDVQPNASYLPKTNISEPDIALQTNHVETEKKEFLKIISPSPLSKVELIPILASKIAGVELETIKPINPVSPIKPTLSKVSSFYTSQQLAYTLNDGYWIGLDFGWNRQLSNRWGLLVQAQYNLGWVILPKESEPNVSGPVLANTGTSNQLYANFPGADINSASFYQSTFGTIPEYPNSFLAHQIGIASGLQYRITNRWNARTLVNSGLLLQSLNEKMVFAIGMQAELGYVLNNRLSFNAQYKVQKPLGDKNYPLLHGFGLGLRWKL